MFREGLEYRQGLGRTLGQGMGIHIRETRQPGMTVFRRFVADYCPALVSDSSSQVKGDLNGRDAIDDASKISVSVPTVYGVAEFLMGGNWSATGVFLYRALNMTPDTAPELMRRFFGTSFIPMFETVMSHVEMAEDLPSGTLDNIF